VTLAGRILVAVFGATLVAATSRGGMLIVQGLWGQAAAAYGVAGVCTTALIREVGRAIPPGDHTDDGGARAPLKAAGPLARLHAARKARHLLKNAPRCCERYWTTAGAQHDEHCYRNRSLA
jgi:hypothetical protein